MVKKIIIDLKVMFFFRNQKCLWDIIEHPETSGAAQFVSYMSMFFVIVSTIGMSLNTMPALKVSKFVSYMSMFFVIVSTMACPSTLCQLWR